MSKYIAKDGFKDLENKFFGIHKAITLLNGGSIEITDFNSLPKSVQDELEPKSVSDKSKVKKNKKGVK
tara:strand:- start:297 stop:500 length:204 start_codon:yes stop_codon:yes gene_type:complete